jgi:hypothetical protein
MIESKPFTGARWFLGHYICGQAGGLQKQSSHLKKRVRCVEDRRGALRISRECVTASLGAEQMPKT